MADGQSAVDAVRGAYERIASSDSAGVLIAIIDQERALAAARRVETALANGAHLPLAGQTVVVKANIDVAGHRTTAACPAYGTVAEQSAPAVESLEQAGAIVVAIANMDQFATGLVGTRSPHGICPNAHWPELIAGGSSSGSAVAVARGWVDLGVGTDTAGSGRVPAAANGIVGLKPTRGRLSTRGVVPACRSLDCVSIFARTVVGAAEAAAAAAGFDADDPWSRPAPAAAPTGARVRIGAPAHVAVPGAEAFAAHAGAELVTIDLTPFLEAGALLYNGAFVAERYAAVGAFIEDHRDEVDPIVAEIILAARELPAWRLARDIDELARLKRRIAPTLAAVDVIAVPTVPRIPTVADVLARPIECNTELGTYTNFVNLLDLCALTLPVDAPATGMPVDAPPPSLTLIGPAWADKVLVDLSGRGMRSSSRSA